MKYLLPFLIVLVTAALFTGLVLPVHQDERVYISIAKGLTQGIVPYRDIFDHKPPGIYFLLMPFVANRENPLAPIRLLVIFTHFLSAYVLYATAKRIDRKTSVLAPLLYLGFIPSFNGLFALPDVFMTACIVFSTYFFFKVEKTSEIFLAGLFAGLALTFKQPAVIPIIIQLIFLLQGDALKKTLVYVSGVVLVWLPVLAYFIATNSLSDAFADIVLFNLFSYPPHALRTTLPGVAGILLPSLVLWAGVFDSLVTGKNEPRVSPFAALVSLGFFTVAFTRPYHQYWIPVLPFAILVTNRFLTENRIAANAAAINILIFLVGFTAFNIR